MNHIDKADLGYLAMIDTTKVYACEALPPGLKGLEEYPETRRFALVRVYLFLAQYKLRSAISTLLYRLSRWIDP